MVTQEGPPSLAGRRLSLDHVLSDARLRDLKPELEQFAVNAWRTPKRILHAACLAGGLLEYHRAGALLFASPGG